MNSVHGYTSRYVAIYCRISVDRNGRAEGVAAQERWGRSYAAQMWPGLPVRVFRDNDVTATRDDVVRPEYQKLTEAIERGEVAHVWAVEQYRIERREIAWFVLADKMEAAGISELHTNRDGIVRVRDEVAGIKAVLGASEVRRLKKRLNDTLAEKAALGEPPGGRPFGYRHARPTCKDDPKTYKIIPEEAEAIRQAADWVLMGWSLASIESELQSRGVRGRHGGVIRATSIKRMVTGPTVAGYRVYRGNIIGKGNWKPILDEETWKACRLKLSQPRRVIRKDGKGEYAIPAKNSGFTGRRYLLTGGLVVCGVCGAPLSGAPRKVSKKYVPYVYCNARNGGSGCVGTVMARIDDYVIGELFDKLDKPEFLNAIAADNHSARRNELVNSLDAIEQQRRELAAMWATPGELTVSEWQEARRGLQMHEQALRRELSEIPPPVVNVDISQARNGWQSMTLDEKRHFVRIFIDRIVLHRAGKRYSLVYDTSRIQIEWRSR
ncbi:recombinase family protein [Actinoalloteichus caeruleus]|uniref:recombinase family protein n=1 Tax=Actinoalloteichus cyanogriseus TaxID=2893586 RepID=UPI003AAE3247